MAAIEDIGKVQEPLGSLLVNRGLLTPEQLEDALAHQKTSGEPLGAIVVARGFAAPATIAQALATQHGGLLKTEYGFATGFSDEDVSQAAAVVEPPLSSPSAERAGTLVAVAPAVTPLLDVADREAVREELSMASAETERLADANERLAAARAELEQRLAQESQRAAALAGELEALRSGGESLAQWQDAVGQWQAAYGELEQRLAARDADVAALRSFSDGGDAGPDGSHAELESRLAEAESARGELERELAAAQAELEAHANEQVSATDGARVELQAQLAEAESARGELERQLAAAHDEVAARTEERDRALAELEDARMTPEVPAAPWADAPRHLLFFQDAEGYQLVERDGPPPAEGARVDGHLVARITREPVPGSQLPCAYLVLD